MKRLKYICLLFISPLLNIIANDVIPSRDVEIDNNGVIVTYSFNGGIYQQDPIYPNAKFWKIPGFGLNEESGRPAILSRWDSFVVPQNATVSIELLECEYNDTSFVLAPSRHALFESDTTGYTLETVPTISPYTGFYPANVVTLGKTLNYRGQEIQKVGIHPIQYNYTNNIVRNYSKIKYRVCFEWNELQERGLRTVKTVPNDPILNNMVLNPPFLTNTTSLTKSATNISVTESNRDYLIVSVPEYEEAIQKFAEWKRTLGFKVHIWLNNDWNVYSLNNTIKSFYNQNNVNLCYLLIVGDIDDVPSYSSYYNRSYVTDQYYARLGDWDNYIPQICVGRISVKNNETANKIFDKIISYERQPILNPDFYKTGLHSAFFEDFYRNTSDGYEDRRFVKTSEEIRDYLQILGKTVHRVYNTWASISPKYWNNDRYSFGEEIPNELQKPLFSWKGRKDSIINYINNGCFYVLYRGHGTDSSWIFSEPFQFTNTHIHSLNNQKKQPVIFSITCQTGKFNSDSECFAETFLSKSDGGCVGILAATENSYSEHNDVLAETMFDAIWPDSVLRIKMRNVFDVRKVNRYPVYELGQILNLGMNYMDEIYGSVDELAQKRLHYTRDIYHYFGDPSMMIRTEVPQEFSPSIKRTDGVISVNTNCDSTRISFYTPSTNQVDSYVGQSISYSTTADSVIVCIDKHNYIPFIAHCDKNIYIQNDTINDERYYVGENILVGKNVTTQKAQGEVLIQNATVKLQGGEVTLHPGTTFVNSNVEINTK